MHSVVVLHQVQDTEQFAVFHPLDRMEMTRLPDVTIRSYRKAFTRYLVRLRVIVNVRYRLRVTVYGHCHSHNQGQG